VRPGGSARALGDQLLDIFSRNCPGHRSRSRSRRPTGARAGLSFAQVDHRRAARSRSFRLTCMNRHGPPSRLPLGPTGHLDAFELPRWTPIGSSSKCGESNYPGCAVREAHGQRSTSDAPPPTGGDVLRVLPVSGGGGPQKIPQEKKRAPPGAVGHASVSEPVHDASGRRARSPCRASSTASRWRGSPSQQHGHCSSAANRGADAAPPRRPRAAALRARQRNSRVACRICRASDANARAPGRWRSPPPR